jgi:hypothetical protein
MESCYIALLVTALLSAFAPLMVEDRPVFDAGIG